MSISPCVGSFGYIYVCSILYIFPGIRPLQYILSVYIESIPKLALRIANYEATGPLGSAGNRQPGISLTMPHGLNSAWSVFSAHWGIGALKQWAHSLDKPAPMFGTSVRFRHLIPTVIIPGDTCILCRRGRQMRLDSFKRPRRWISHL